MMGEEENEESQLTQLFKLYESRFSAIESAIAEIADTIGRITNGVNGVIDEHRKGVYGSKLSSREGDFAPYKEFYGALSNGSDIIQDLIDNMLQNKVDENGIDEYVDNALGQFKGRFGKIIGIKDEITEPSAIEPTVEVSIESEKTIDPVGDLMKKMMSVRK